MIIMALFTFHRRFQLINEVNWSCCVVLITLDPSVCSFKQKELCLQAQLQ